MSYKEKGPLKAKRWNKWNKQERKRLNFMKEDPHGHLRIRMHIKSPKGSDCIISSISVDC